MSRKAIVFKTLAAVTLCLALGCAVITYYFWQWLHTPVAMVQEDLTIRIHSGENLTGLSKRLHKNGLLRWPRIWVLAAKLEKRTHIRVGEFKLAAMESPSSLLTRFQSSDVVQYAVTLIDGHAFKDFIAKIHRDERIQKTLEGPFSAAHTRIPGIEQAHLEGWLFPDTYQFTRGDSDVLILQRAYQSMQRVLEEEWQQRAPDLPYKSAYEALIMASIVEKETGAPHEREEIAGVFVRRLQKGMRLQTDPTVIYGMGEQYQGNIRRRDLRKPTPYNTYTIHGLPPTPIAMPGRAAIHAALHPKPGSTLYFVAKGDGTHYFSETLEEHTRAVNKYQRTRRKNYSSQYKKTQSE